MDVCIPVYAWGSWGNLWTPMTVHADVHSCWNHQSWHSPELWYLGPK